MADDTKQLQFSPGMTLESWKALWNYLKYTAANLVSRAHQNLRRWAGKLPLAIKLSFSLVDQLLRTLMRLRLGRMKQELVDQFGISRSAVSCCLITWVNVSAPRFTGYLATLDWSPDRNMPNVFTQSYSKTFCITDATELHCESPSSLSGQSQLQISYHTERVS